VLKSGFVQPFALGAVIALALVGTAVLAGPLLTRNQSFMCPLQVGFPTSFHGNGFVVSKPTGFPNSMQFVIRPNSTAFLQTTYSISEYTQNNTAKSIYANWTQYFLPIEYWYKLGSTPSGALSASQVGMTAYPVNVTTSGDYVLTSTYEISAMANALQGAYTAGWFSTCGPQIVITIGYNLYTGPGLTGGGYL